MATCDDDTTWLIARRDKTRLLIEAYEDAITAIASGAQSYTLDTGQTKQTVTKANLTEMRRTIAALETRLASLEMRLCGRGRAVLVPGF